MKTSKYYTTLFSVFCFVLLVGACSSDDDMNDDPDDPEEPSGVHWVQLFDGDKFKDDHIIIDKEGEYPDLSDLPGSDGKDWTDEADSFKVGDSTTIEVWTATDFEGDYEVYEGGEYPSVDEPYSMKVYFGDYDADKDSGDHGEGCYIQLFDGDNFTDDSLTVKEPGEYPDLDELPDADGKNWTDEADSFKVGEGTTVTVWTETDFEGDSTVYEAGDYKSVDEPYSLKIECEE